MTVAQITSMDVTVQEDSLLFTTSIKSNEDEWIGVGFSVANDNHQTRVRTLGLNPGSELEVEVEFPSSELELPDDTLCFIMIDEGEEVERKCVTIEGEQVDPTSPGGSAGLPDLSTREWLLVGGLTISALRALRG